MLIKMMDAGDTMEQTLELWRGTCGKFVLASLKILPTIPLVRRLKTCTKNDYAKVMPLLILQYEQKCLLKGQPFILVQVSHRWETV